jgi:short-subunit dehydrogenase
MNILVIGANSAIAKAVARRYANPANAFYLVARNEEKLNKNAEDLKARGANQVEIKSADFAKAGIEPEVIESAKASLGRIDMVIRAHSILGDQAVFEKDLDALNQLYQVNTLSSLNLLTLLANEMEVQKQGNIVFIASVAADRGRPSNYAYGSSKAAVVTFLQGMRARLAKSNVHVMTVKPGFVESPMTEHIEGSGPLWSTPEKVAEIIQKGLVKRRNTLYTPWFWWGIMTIIKSIPECIFKKLNL